jgi:hypothetical protein
MAWQGPSGTTPRTAVTTRQYRRDARARGRILGRRHPAAERDGMLIVTAPWSVPGLTPLM